MYLEEARRFPVLVLCPPTSAASGVALARKTEDVLVAGDDGERKASDVDDIRFRIRAGLDGRGADPVARTATSVVRDKRPAIPRQLEGPKKALCTPFEAGIAARNAGVGDKHATCGQWTARVVHDSTSALLMCCG